MNPFPFLATLSFILHLISCHDTQNPDIQSYHMLLKCWTHSYEEQTNEDTLIYRLCDYYPEFPPSRYRERFILKENHEATYLVLAPDDAHYLADGTWTFNSVTKKLTIFTTAGEVVYNYNYGVQEVTEDKLVMTRN